MLHRFSIAANFGLVKGYLNPAELLKAALGALGFSTVLGLLIAVLSSVSDHAAAIFPDPHTAALVGFILAQLVDQLRRLGHGTPPTPSGIIPVAPDPPGPPIPGTPSQQFYRGVAVGPPGRFTPRFEALPR